MNYAQEIFNQMQALALAEGKQQELYPGNENYKYYLIASVRRLKLDNEYLEEEEWISGEIAKLAEENL
jgi:hypothetical protein